MFTSLFAHPDPYRDLHTLQRHINQIFGEWAQPRLRRAAATPAFDAYDRGEAYAIVADLPGLSHEDLEVEVSQDTLTIRGERKIKAPEGYAVHRREREPLKFARSFTFPTKIDPEKVNATVRQGVLTVELAKLAEAQPRKISISVGQ